MTEVYLLNINNKIDEELCKVNFPSRYEKSSRYRSKEDRIRCIGVGVLLVKVLGFTERDVLLSDQGKPYSSYKNIKFSVSHSGDYCVLAVSDNEVGVDIEKPDEKHYVVADKVLCSDELISFNENNELFFKYWTMKESLSKALGIGMGLHFDSVNTIPMLEGGYIEIKGKKYFGKNIQIGDYELSICTENKQDTVRITEI